MAAVLSLAVVGGVVSAVPLCSDMSASVVYADSEYYKVTEGALTYFVYDDHAEVNGCDKYAESVEILSEFAGVPVTSIGNYAFDGCTYLTEITIHDSVTNIGYYAFNWCKSLTEIKVPDSVISIGYNAFNSCASLTEIKIPDSVTSIGDDAFSYCTSLTEINVSENNSEYCSINGVLFNKDKTELYTYPCGKTDKKYVIPDSVTSVGKRAFEPCKDLTEITIPDSVTSIGEYVFVLCEGLTRITIPDSVASIGNCAFSGCTSLTEINVSENNSEYCSINGVLFNKDKTELYTYPQGKTDKKYVIPDSVTRIGDHAFAGCENLTEITIPDSVAGIEENAFYSCESLTEITIPDSVTSIGDFAFAFCESLTEITIPDSITILEDSTFIFCTSLTKITIPDSVTSIGNRAFAGCTDVTIYGYTGSAAEKYAAEKEFTFIALDAEKTVGDLNGDGAVNAADAVILQKYILGAAKLVSNAQADLNGDGIVNSLDMVQMRKKLFG